MVWMRNAHSEPVAAVRPGAADDVNPAHPVVRAAIDAGHLVACERPFVQGYARADLARLRDENEKLKARVAELEGLLEVATKPAQPRRVAREG